MFQIGTKSGLNVYHNWTKTEIKLDLNWTKNVLYLDKVRIKNWTNGRLKQV